MPNVSIVPGSPQSSTSAVNRSMVVPVDRITAAMPVTVACLLPGVAVHEAPGLLIDRPSTNWALIRTSAAWSLYSRFPLAEQHVATKPNVACDAGSDRLGISAGSDSKTPSSAKTGSPSIWPPPVAFPGVLGGGGAGGHGEAGGLVSQGSKSTFCSRSMILSPVPPAFRGISIGPDGLPHQLFSAFSCGVTDRKSTGLNLSHVSK